MTNYTVDLYIHSVNLLVCITSRRHTDVLVSFIINPFISKMRSLLFVMTTSYKAWNTREPAVKTVLVAERGRRLKWSMAEDSNGQWQKTQNPVWKVVINVQYCVFYYISL